MDAQNSSKAQENEGDQQPSQLPILSEKDKLQGTSDHVSPLQEADTRHIMVLALKRKGKGTFLYHATHNHVTKAQRFHAWCPAAGALFTPPPPIQRPGNTLAYGYFIDSSQVATLINMTHDKLPRPAEDIRNEIKRMIPETASSRQPPESQARVLEVDEHGTKTYGGELLMDKISLMKDEMKISGRWGYRLVHFPKPTKLNNEEQKQGYVIPLNNLTLTPGGVLEEGCYTYITDDPMVSPGATAVFILPY